MKHHLLKPLFLVASLLPLWATGAAALTFADVPVQPSPDTTAPRLIR
jgi:hypothetical protein